jgi:hypothetical protein
MDVYHTEKKRVVTDVAGLNSVCPELVCPAFVQRGHRLSIDMHVGMGTLRQ